MLVLSACMGWCCVVAYAGDICLHMLVLCNVHMMMLCALHILVLSDYVDGECFCEF